VEASILPPRLRLTQPVGPTARVSVLSFLPEDGRSSSFRNVVILLKYRRWRKSKKTAFTDYLPMCYEETLNTIRVLCEKENIWVSIDETTDTSGRKVANVIIGGLKNDQQLSEK
jgi:hypothetical protein